MRPSRSDSKCSFPVLSIPGGFVIVNFVEDTAVARSEGPVVHTGRAAGVGRSERLLAALAVPVVANYQVALHQVDLLPVVVHERLGRESAGLDLEEAGAAAALRRLVEVRGEDLLPESRRIARRALPTAFQVDLHELQMLLGLHSLLDALGATGFQAARAPSSPYARPACRAETASRNGLRCRAEKRTPYGRCYTLPRRVAALSRKPPCRKSRRAASLPRCRSRRRSADESSLRRRQALRACRAPDRA